jgi:arginyl-tRNA synthetase
MSLSVRVEQSVRDALSRLADAGQLGDKAAARLAIAPPVSWTVERPKRPEHGDLATNVAMVLTKKVGKPPRAIAEALVRALEGDAVVKSAEIAGPGFVNVRVHPSALHAELAEVLRAGKGFGRAPAASGERINLEFVSANPTGPINVASGRNAIFGDAVATLLEATGNRVTREYYINDFGNQIRKFSESVRAVAEGRDVGEDGYHGAYIEEIAAYLKKVDPAILKGDPDTLARTCITVMLRGLPSSAALPGIRRSLADLGIHMDVWFSEESLHRWGAVPAAVRQLEATGYLAAKDGAVFFVGKGADEDKERVVKKSNGDYTYFASDIAYFSDKLSRGYDRVMVVLGSDHHGYVPRIRNVLEALGLPKERFEALLYQLVFIYKGGELVKSSKRAGNFVTAEEVMEEIDEAARRKGAGRDALRFFFLSRSATVNVEFDVDLAKKKSLDNPVFYVQYGHARLCSILRKATEIGLSPRPLTLEEWGSLTHPDELAIAARLSEFPGLVREAAAAREPHKIVFYVQELARDFQSYFTRLKGEKDPILPMASVRAKPGWESSWDFAKTHARLAWIEAIRVVYAAGLELLGVSAPERMDRPAAGSGEASPEQDDDEADET